LPGGFFAALAGMALCYLVLIEIGKRIFYGATPTTTPPTPRRYSSHRHLRRRATYFSTATHQPGLSSTSQPPLTPRFKAPSSLFALQRRGKPR
jgi:P-type Mg2+ transporter